MAEMVMSFSWQSPSSSRSSGRLCRGWSGVLALCSEWKQKKLCCYGLSGVELRAYGQDGSRRRNRRGGGRANPGGKLIISYLNRGLCVNILGS
ncbi:hypothetical protein PAHAL_2G009300 [Panicum hallii]|uniref:Uncharacterized protein n=1 Tax=Panicum hallii TaxID=206008 RepID=A0A2T8KMC5_9POAL|nr:hypothetical protein PAHAL_2G009300 [Panicum hallii]